MSAEVRRVSSVFGKRSRVQITVIATHSSLYNMPDAIIVPGKPTHAQANRYGGSKTAALKTLIATSVSDGG